MEIGVINSVQRALTLKIVDPLRIGNVELWRYKRSLLPITPFASGFPWRSILERAGYAGKEDLLGADERELGITLGICEYEAKLVLDGLWGRNRTAVGYFGTDGRYVDVRPVTVLANTERTTDGASAAIELGDANTLRLLVDVAAVDASLVLTVKTRHDASDAWRSVIGSIAAITAVGHYRSVHIGLDREIRVEYSITKLDEDDQTIQGDAEFSVAGEVC